jgi:hypothetical protein
MHADEEFDSLLSSAIRLPLIAGSASSIPTAEELVAYVNGWSSEAEAMAIRAATLAHPSVLDEVLRLSAALGLAFPGVTEVVVTLPITQISALATSALRLAAAGSGASGYHTSELWESPEADVTLRIHDGRLVASIAASSGEPLGGVEIALERVGSGDSLELVAVKTTSGDGSLDFGDLLTIPPLRDGEEYRLRVVLPGAD